MVNKQSYFIHFARLFFAGLAIGICSFVSYLWKIYQPILLTLQCQSTFAEMKYSHVTIWNWLKHFHWSNLLPSFPFLSSSSSNSCHSYIQIEYPINVIQYIIIVRSILLIYAIYQGICLYRTTMSI